MESAAPAVDVLLRLGTPSATTARAPDRGRPGAAGGEPATGPVPRLDRGGGTAGAGLTSGVHSGLT